MLALIDGNERQLGCPGMEALFVLRYIRRSLTIVPTYRPSGPYALPPRIRATCLPGRENRSCPETLSGLPFLV